MGLENTCPSPVRRAVIPASSSEPSLGLEYERSSEERVKVSLRVPDLLPQFRIWTLGMFPRPSGSGFLATDAQDKV